MIDCWRRYGRQRHHAGPVTAKFGGGVEFDRSGFDLAKFGEELPQCLKIDIE